LAYLARKEVEVTEELRVSANSWSQQQLLNASARQSLSNTPLISSSTNSSSKYDGFPTRKKLDRSARVDTASISDLAKWMYRNTSHPNPGADPAGSGLQSSANQAQASTSNTDSLQIGSKPNQAVPGSVTQIRESLENYQNGLDLAVQKLNSSASRQAVNKEAIFKVQDFQADSKTVQNTSPTRQLLLRSTQAALRQANQSSATGTLVNLYR